MARFVFEKQLAELPDNPGVTVETEDSGQALIFTIEDEAVSPTMFVRLQSWDSIGDDNSDIHRDLGSLIGKRVRITVETID